MSYDFYVSVDTGGDERHYIEPFFADELPGLGTDGMAGTAVATATGHARCGNYTSNVSSMWTLCLTAAMQDAPEAQGWAGDDGGDSTLLHLRDLQGKTAGDIAPVLAAAVKLGLDHIEELRLHNPGNGWGNAEGAVTYLWDIQRFCEAHPNGRLEISS